MNKEKRPIDWGETFKINLIRSIFAGIIITILVAILDTSGKNPLIWLGFPVLYYLIVFPIGMILNWFASLFGGLGALLFRLIGLVLGFSVMLGDPFVFLLKMFKPEWFKIERYDFLNFAIVIFAYKKTLTE